METYTRTLPDRGACGNGRALFWFRVEDELAPLLDLTEAQLKAYLVVSRAIQRDQNGGRVSARKLAAQIGVTFGYANEVLAELCSRRLLIASKEPGKTTIYQLPFEWRGAERSTPGEHLDPTAEHHCSTAVMHYCPTPVEQHLEKHLEGSDKLAPPSLRSFEAELRTHLEAIGAARTPKLAIPDDQTVRNFAKFSRKRVRDATPSEIGAILMRVRDQFPNYRTWGIFAPFKRLFTPDAVAEIRRRSGNPNTIAVAEPADFLENLNESAALFGSTPESGGSSGTQEPASAPPTIEILRAKVKAAVDARGPTAWANWFSGAVWRLEDGELVIIARDEHSAAWIETEYGPEIKLAVGPFRTIAPQRTAAKPSLPSRRSPQSQATGARQGAFGPGWQRRS